jgi:protein TonB
MDIFSRCYPGGPDLGLARSIEALRQPRPGRPIMGMGKPVSEPRDARTMALASMASLLIHTLIAARLLFVPGVALQTPLDTDALVDVLLYTPEPSAAETTSPDEKVQAEPEPPPAPIADGPALPHPQVVPPTPGPPAEAASTIPPPEAMAPPLPAEVATPAAPAEPMPPAPLPEAVSPVRPPPAAPPATQPKPPAHRPITRLPSHRSAEPVPDLGVPGPEPEVPTMAAAVTPARPLRGFAGNRDPSYPEAARRRGEQGRVMLRVNVSSGGEPVSVTVQQSSGFPRLDDAAAAAVRQWRFEPAARDGKTVAGIAEVPIVFRLEN